MNKVCLIICLLILLSELSTSQDKRNILFKNITNTDGLSHSTVFTITQDSKDYVWFGTRDGLNRYDGSDFRVFRPVIDDSTSVSSNHIRALLIDSGGTLWVGGNNGISIYSQKNENFRNYRIDYLGDESYVTSIVEDDKKHVWISSANGIIYKFSKEKNSIEKVNIQGIQSFTRIDVLTSTKDFLLAGTNNGLFRIFYEESIYEKIDLGNDDIRIRNILPDTKNGFWLGTHINGLMHVDSLFHLKNHYKSDILNINSLTNNNIRSLAWHNSGDLWIGTYYGLSIFDTNKESFQNFYEEVTRPYSLSQNSVRSLFQDKQGGVWLGTFFGGVSYYHPGESKFDILNQNVGKFSLNDNVVSFIEEDRNGNVWIGTNDEGLNFWNRKSNRFTYFSNNPKIPTSLSSNNLKSVLFTSNNKLLIGTHQSGLNLFDPAVNKSIIYRHSDNPNSIANNGIYALLRDSKNRIWIGTQNGLDEFILEEQRFIHYKSDSKGNPLISDEIFYLFEDSRNRIWIGTTGGVNIFYPEQNIFESYNRTNGTQNSLSNNEVTCIVEDSMGRIWIGTRSGLNLFDEINRQFINYSSVNGLPNNTIYGILEDDKGCLWISTNNGLSCFNPKTNEYKNYGVNDGIQSAQFNMFSFCKLSDGLFLFGGINGITIFNPKNITEPPFNPNVLFSELDIFNKRIIPNDDSGVLKNHISNTDRLELDYNQNAFTLKFTSINFVASQKINFAYRLEGFDKEWKRDNNRSADYSNLSPGDYVFKVKSINSYGIESEEVSQLFIKIKKPWWFSNLAITIYLFMVLTAGYILYLLFRERIRTNNQLHIERLEKKKLNEINQMKLQFFTNISHEFRTPLTLIISPLQMILEKRINDVWLKKQHDVIFKNADRLLHLIDQLMDFRKSEIGKMKIKVSKGDFTGLINEIYLSFAAVASQNNIVYTFENKGQKLNFFFDQSIIEKIVFNLLSNAFKFTPKGGSISIELGRSGKWINLEITDSGKGIPKDKMSLIFERFYRVDETNVNPGTGIGLALTKRLVELHHGTIEVENVTGKGAKFIVTLPLSEEVFSEDEVDFKLPATSISYEIPEQELEVEHEAIQTTATDGEQDSILIVEDNPEIVTYLIENLSENFKTNSAQNGEEALKLIYNEHPSLIISDVMMPVMDGISLCKKIKQNIKTCHIPVVLLTAKSSIEDQLEGIETGADDYIAKPFSMNLLEAKLNNIIKTRKRLKEYYSSNVDIHPDKIAFNSLDEELLSKAKKIVEENLLDPEFTVDIFAREIGMSRSNLHLKLKAITGEAATDFIKKIQFAKAVQLLEANRHSVAEISYMVGFNSASYFSTSFKKYFGYLPTEHIYKSKKTKF